MRTAFTGSRRTRREAGYVVTLVAAANDGGIGGAKDITHNAAK